MAQTNCSFSAYLTLMGTKRVRPDGVTDALPRPSQPFLTTHCDIRNTNLVLTHARTKTKIILGGNYNIGGSELLMEV